MGYKYDHSIRIDLLQNNRHCWHSTKWALRPGNAARRRPSALSLYKQRPRNCQFLLRRRSSSNESFYKYDRQFWAEFAEQLLLGASTIREPFDNRNFQFHSK